MTEFLFVYILLGLICSFFLDRIFREFPNDRAPHRVVGVLGMAWMLPGTAFSLLVYLFNPVFFGYNVQQTINKPRSSHPNIRQFFSCVVTILLIAIVSIRVIKGIE